jgi:ligand-binding sensor domain-containing protein
LYHQVKKDKTSKNIVMKKLSILLIFSCFSLFAIAQSWDDIVAPSKVNDVLETSSTVWMATNGGVVSIDKQTNVVSQFTKAKNGLPSNEVEGIAIDNAGNLWIGTYTMNLAKYNGTSWTTIPYPSSFPEMRTHSVRVDQNDVLWAGTSKGLVKYDGTTWELYNSSNTNLTSFIDGWNIEFDQQGNLYVVSIGVMKFDGTTWTDITTSSNLNSYFGGHTEMLSNGTLVYANNFSGRTVGLYDGTAWTIYTASNNDFPAGDIEAIDKDDNDNIYISIKGNGVYKLQNGAWISETLPSSSIDKDAISTMFTDNEDNLWLANSFDFAKIGNGSTNNININLSPIQSNEVAKVYHKNNDIFILNNTIISHYDAATTSWSDITVPLNTPVLNGSLKNMAITENGNYWVSAGWSELYNFDGQSWTLYTAQNSSLPLANIWDMEWDESSQTLWLATGKGLVKLKNQQFTIYSSSNTILNNDDVRHLELRNGTIYTGAGTYVYSFDGMTWTDLTQNNPESLRTMYVDNAENIWISNWNGGVSKYENSTWTAITTLQNDKVTTIVETNNKFYFGTETNGVAILDGTNWAYFKEDNSNVTHNTINHLSVDINNKLWIATEGGVSIYTPAPSVSNKEIRFANEANLNVFPNPITNQATIQFTLNSSQNIRLGVYDINGRLVQSIIQNEIQPEGKLIYNFEKEQLTSGIYLVKLEFENSVQTVKVMIR